MGWVTSGGGGGGVAATDLPRLHKHNLVVKYVTAATVDIDASELAVVDASNNVVLLRDVNLTVDITASGANGLDTGSEGVSTLYYLWVIYNESTSAGLISESSTLGTITLPSGYTYGRLVGTVYNDGSSNFYEFYQTGDYVAFETPIEIYSAESLTTSFVAKTLPAQVPSSGVTILDLISCVEAETDTNTGIISPESGGGWAVAFEIEGAINTANQSRTGKFKEYQFRLQHQGGSSIYARNNSTGTGTNKALFVYGYKIPR